TSVNHCTGLYLKPFFHSVARDRFFLFSTNQPLEFSKKQIDWPHYAFRVFSRRGRNLPESKTDRMDCRCLGHTNVEKCTTIHSNRTLQLAHTSSMDLGAFHNRCHPPLSVRKKE